MEKLNHGTRKMSGKLGVGLRRACSRGPPAPSLYPTAHSAVFLSKSLPSSRHWGLCPQQENNDIPPLG